MKTCMRYLAVVFAVAMMITAFTVSANAFSDVEATNDHITAIEAMTNLGILGGYEDGTFRPDSFVRRDEMAKIIFVTYTTYVDSGEGSDIFSDVDENSWAKGYITWCASKEIVGGYEDGTFRPAGNITYDEALKMVCALLGYTDFSSDLWPTDVRMKGLIDLELGKGLENVDGSTALTRAQVVQLVYNAFYKPMYQEVKTTEMFPGVNVAVETTEKTIAKDIWKINEISAQIIATENYAYKNDKLSISTTKLEDEEKVTLLITNKDGSTEVVTKKLADIYLEEYVGKSDEIFLFNVDIITKIEDGSFISVDVKGRRKDNITSGYADKGDHELITVYTEGGTSGNLSRTKYGIKIDDINHYDDDFKNLIRLNFNNETGVADAIGLVDHTGKEVDYFQYYDNANRPKRDRYKQNIAWLLVKNTYNKFQAGIDSDGDGYYEYLLIENKEPYRISSVTDTQVTIEFVYDTKVKYTFDIENVESVVELKAGEYVYAYFEAHKLYITNTFEKVTSFATKYIPNTSVTIYGKGTCKFSYTSTDAALYVRDKFSNFAASVKPLVGVNAEGQYNYVTYYLLDGEIIWFETFDTTTLSGGNNKAILLYVATPTDPQINEETKRFERYYPAYLLINGREQLVNLNPNDAIDGALASTVAQEGSPYRQYTVDDNGVDRTMFPNVSVTYTVDEDGYYSLSTTAEDVFDSENNLIEKVINVPEDNYKLSINESTGLLEILDNEGNVCEIDGEKLNKVIVSPASTIYFEKTDEEVSGMHVYVDFYKGSEIPEKFDDVNIQDTIYLYYDELEKLWVIDTIRLTGALTSEEEDTSVTVDYTKDARAHLIALAEPEAILGEDGKVYASYTFKNLYNYEDITVVNTEKVYADANKDITIGAIYAWDAELKDYVAVGAVEAIEEYEINDILASKNLIFTEEDKYAEGLKLADTVKIIAVTNAETAETKLITVEDLRAQFDLIKQYNEEEGGSLTLSITMGTFLENEDDEEKQIAYITVLFMEYDIEEDKYFIAGQEI